MNSGTITRRHFLGTILAASIAPAFVRAQAGKKLNVAIIGCGGRGAGNLSEIAAAGENIVALCDVNANNLAAAAKKYPGAKTFADYRKRTRNSKTSTPWQSAPQSTRTHLQRCLRCR